MHDFLLHLGVAKGMETKIINLCAAEKGETVGRLKKLKMELHLAIDDEEVVGASIGRYVVTHTNGGL